MDNKPVQEYKGKIAFFYKGSWYHRTRYLNEDGEIKYSKKGGYATPEEAEFGYFEYDKLFEEQKRNFKKKSCDKEILFSDYLKIWIDAKEVEGIETTTFMIYNYAVNHLIIPNIPYDIKLKLVTEEYINELLKIVDKLGKSTANKTREVLLNSFKDAKTNGYITINVVENSDKYFRDKPKIKILSKEEIKKLLLSSCKSNWYLEILLALFCGLRKGEILGLKFGDFDLENKTVSINRQISTEYIMGKNGFKVDSTKLIEKPPKTENSYRTLKIPDVVAIEVKKRKELVEIQKKNYGDNYVDNDYICCRENGKVRNQSSLNNFLNKLCKQKSIPSITVHGLRHMFATILIENQVELEVISAILGHSSVHTTFDLYCDVMEEKGKISAFMNTQFKKEELFS